MQRPTPPLRLRDLVTGPSGRLSKSALWANVGCAAATGMFIYSGVTGTPLNETVFGLFLATVCGFASVSKFLNVRAGRFDSPEYPPIYQPPGETTSGEKQC